MKVFVYGTLKHGGHNHGLLKNAEFVCNAHTITPFVLLDSVFPVMTPTGTGNMRVAGEVYEFEDAATLWRLDQLEGEGHMYDRVLIEVDNVDDAGSTPIEVWTYVGCEDAFKRRGLGTQWLSRSGVFEFNRQKESVA